MRSGARERETSDLAPPALPTLIDDNPVDSNEIFGGVLNGGGGGGGNAFHHQFVMGSAAEEKTNGWSEDEADSLLSMVGGWRLEEFGGGGVALTNGHGHGHGGHSHSHVNGVNVNGSSVPNGIPTTNGISSSNGGSPPVSSCVIHAMPHICWCEVCSKGLCRVCSQEHTSRGHNTRTLKEMSDTLTSTLEAETLNLGKLLNEVYRVERNQQDIVMKIIDALSQAKRDLEEELMNGFSVFQELPQVHDLLTSARKSLSNGNSESLTHLSALISSLTCRKQQLENCLFRAMVSVSPLYACGSNSNLETLRLIHNYTSAKLGLNNFAFTNGNGVLKSSQKALISPPKYSPTTALSLGSVSGPRFYFDMEIQAVPLGRIIIETRPDVAPKMCENFKALTTKERGFGFQGCVVFQCWKGESVITGDFEHNNGRGGHSIYEEGLFMPEDTRLPAIRGAIGMRRTQKRHDSKGLVGSQFRIILQDMPGFTGIFGHILEGIEIVDKISECGDPSGNPTKRISIRKCGALK